MQQEVVEINNSLPTLEQIISRRMPTISAQQLTDITAQFRHDGAIAEKRQIIANMLGFVAGIDLLTKSGDQKEPLVIEQDHQPNLSTESLGNGNSQFSLEEFKQDSGKEHQIIDTISKENKGINRIDTDKTAISRILYQLHQKQQIDRSESLERFRENSAKALGNRMQGMIHSGIISPIAGEIVNYTVDFVTQKITEYQLQQEVILEKQFLLDNYERSAELTISGVSAGDGYLRIYKDKDDAINTPKSKSLFARRNNSAIDKYIDKTFDVFGKKYNESLQESERQSNVSSLDLIKERNNEINQNVSVIRRGNGHAVFKNATEFNETFGGSLRYLFDQAYHTSHLVSPQVTGAINATTGTIGHGVSELYELSLSDSAKQYLAETYNNMMGKFPTENQRFLVQTTMGALVGQVTTNGLNLAIVNKANNPRAMSSLSSSNTALEIEKKLASTTQVNVHSVNAGHALNKKLSALAKGQNIATKVNTLPDGRIRYYTEEIAASQKGATRGASHVTEYNPITGAVRSWHECYPKLER
jgi:hypothetical protein